MEAKPESRGRAAARRRPPPLVMGTRSTPVPGQSSSAAHEPGAGRAGALAHPGVGGIWRRDSNRRAYDRGKIHIVGWSRRACLRWLPAKRGLAHPQREGDWYGVEESAGLHIRPRLEYHGVPLGQSYGADTIGGAT